MDTMNYGIKKFYVKYMSKKRKGIYAYAVFKDMGSFEEQVGIFKLKDYPFRIALSLANALRDELNEELEKKRG